MCGDKKKTDYRRSGAERIVREVKKHELRKKEEPRGINIHEHFHRHSFVNFENISFTFDKGLSKKGEVSRVGEGLFLQMLMYAMKRRTVFCYCFPVYKPSSKSQASLLLSTLMDLHACLPSKRRPYTWISTTEDISRGVSKVKA